jgi:hypothetical protein
MRNVSDKNCRESQNTHFLFNNFFLENSDVYEIMWKNFVEPARTQMTIWRMYIACWITKATGTLTIFTTVLRYDNFTSAINSDTHRPLFPVV